MELNSKNIKKIIFIIFCGALIFTALQNVNGVFDLVGKILSFFSPVIAALCIAFVLNVLLSALENKVFGFFGKAKRKFVRRLRRPICLVLTYLIALGIIGLLILVIIPDLVDTVIYIAEKMPSFVLSARNFAEGMLQRFDIEEQLPQITVNWGAFATTLKNWFTNSYSQIFGDAINITTSVFSGLFDTIFSIVISVYVLAQKEKIARFMRSAIDAFLPENATSKIYHIALRAHEAFSRFIGGQLIESIILGSLCFIGMLIFRFPNALIISVFICVTSLVPVVGATIGVIIGFLLIVITSPVKAMLFVIFFLILQQLEGNLIYPKVVGRAVGLPGVIVVSAVLVGGNIGGVLGALIAVPTSALIFVLLKEAIAYLQTKKAPAEILPEPDENA